MKQRLTVLVFGALLLGLSGAPGADWPQWRGPGRNGLSSERISEVCCCNFAGGYGTGSAVR